MSDPKLKDFPAQKRERLQWIVDVVREHQNEVRSIFVCLEINEPRAARTILMNMHKQDRDAILQSGGILTDAQIELLK